MFCPFIVSTLTEGKRHFSGVRWLSEKTQRHHFDHIPLGFTHICNRAVICLLRVFSLKFGPIIHTTPMLPLLSFSPPPQPRHRRACSAWLCLALHCVGSVERTRGRLPGEPPAESECETCDHELRYATRWGGRVTVDTAERGKRGGESVRRSGG